jgi:cytochrome b pre-mRNA-processing protein 3
MKKRAQAFYGRAGAYEAALEAGDGQGLAEALARNVYGGAPGDAQRLAAYALQADRAYRSLSLEDILGGRHGFPPPAEVDAGRRV